MLKILFKSIIISLLLYAAIILFVKSEVHNTDIPVQDANIQEVAISSKDPIIKIKQVFIPKENNLSRINIMFCNNWRRNNEGITFKIIINALIAKFKDPAVFSLYDSREEKLLYRKNFNIFSNNIFLKNKLRNQCFSLDPVKDSKNKEFYYEISFIKPVGFENITMLESDTVYVKSRLFVNDRLIKEKSTVFSTFVTIKIIGFHELLNRMSQYKPWFFKTIFLFFLAYLFILSSVFIMMILIDLYCKNSDELMSNVVFEK